MDLGQMLGDDEIRGEIDRIENGETSGNYWKIPFGKSEVRLLPRLESKVPWKAVTSHRYNPLKLVSTCLKTFGGKNCPVCDRAWEMHESSIKAENDVSYVVRPTVRYLMNVYIVKDDTKPENNGTIKLISVGIKLFQQIMGAYKSEDLGKAIFDVENGFNFILDKKKTGDYPDYSSSRFYTKKTKLVNLNDILNKLINIDDTIKKESPEELRKNFSFLWGNITPIESHTSESRTEEKKEPVQEKNDSSSKKVGTDIDKELDKLLED